MHPLDELNTCQQPCKIIRFRSYCLYQYVSPGGYTCRFDMIFDRWCIGACGWQIVKPVVCLKVNEPLLLQQKPVTVPPVEPEAVSDPHVSLQLAAL